MNPRPPYPLRRLLVLVGCVLAAQAILSGTAAAANCDTSWKAAVSGAWTTQSDWTNGVPTAASNACITVPGTYTVTLVDSQSATKGKNGAAAVLGTTWLTRDQCDGTYFAVQNTTNDPRGEIRVTAYHPNRHTVLLKRGQSYLAPAPGYR